MDRPWRAFLRRMQHIEIKHGAPASPESNRFVQNNAGEPGSQTGSRAKITKASERPHVGFLHSIFGFLIVRQYAARDAVQVLVVAPDQRCERGSIALSGAVQQLAVGRSSQGLPPIDRIGAGCP